MNTFYQASLIDGISHLLVWPAHQMLDECFYLKKTILQWFPPFHPAVQLGCASPNKLDSSRVESILPGQSSDTNIRYTSQRQYKIPPYQTAKQKINLYQLTTIDLRSNW